MFFIHVTINNGNDLAVRIALYVQRRALLVNPAAGAFNVSFVFNFFQTEEASVDVVIFCSAVGASYCYVVE